VNSILATILALFVGAVLSLGFAARPRVASAFGAMTAMASCGYGGWSAVQALRTGGVQASTFSWSLPNAALSFGLDPLSAFFLCPLFLVGALAACYGRVYLIEHAPHRNLAVPWAAYNLMLAGMALVLVARHAILFLFAWEVMSLAAYLLVSFDHQQASVRRASFVYLIATHIGVACLLALFLALGSLAHSFEFGAMAATPMPSAAIASLLFLLALIGFGAKAGLFPLHVWLPEAHAAAPTHVSAVMSGVLIKMGVYGILRVVMLLGGPRPYWGPLLMTLGVVGGAVGIGCSLYQRDIKRLLAYSSVENVGLILLGLGTGLWGISSNRPAIAMLGTVGGLLHVWNHAVMKGLMFLGAGSLAHRCHSKDIEQLGGLCRRMPQTATGLVVGATAMAGLPPLNGFVSEWLLYSGLMRAALAAEGRYAVMLLAAIASVSLIGAMAALSFARLIGMALLGEPRASRAEAATEASAFMTIPMLLLGGMALTIALTPDVFVGLFQATSAQLLGHAAACAATPIGLAQLGVLNRVLLCSLVVGVGAAALLQSKDRIRQEETWSCGFVAPTHRMQYSGRAFSELFTSGILPRALGPRLNAELPSGLFPTSARIETTATDPVTRSVYEPFFERWASRFVQLRFMQQGILHVYVLYILVTLLFALAWSATMGRGFR
jgi:hydrogenase-4 component B